MNKSFFIFLAIAAFGAVVIYASDIAIDNEARKQAASDSLDKHINEAVTAAGDLSASVRSLSLTVNGDAGRIYVDSVNHKHQTVIYNGARIISGPANDVYMIIREDTLVGFMLYSSYRRGDTLYHFSASARLDSVPIVGNHKEYKPLNRFN